MHGLKRASEAAEPRRPYAQIPADPLADPVVVIPHSQTRIQTSIPSEKPLGTNESYYLFLLPFRSFIHSRIWMNLTHLPIHIVDVSKLSPYFPCSSC